MEMKEACIISFICLAFTQEVFCSNKMLSSRYSQTPMGKMLLEHLEAINKPIDLTKLWANTARELKPNLTNFKWYLCRMAHIDEEVVSIFVELNLDAETQTFLQNCDEKSNYVFTQLAHGILKGVMGLFMSLTTINGILNRGSMFVLSQAQFCQLMNIDENWKADSLLDLGAGDGQVTKIMARHFNQIYVTEQSPAMRWRLRQMNYEVLEIDDWMMRTYDVISCLNLLDRCDKPISLLENIRKSLNPKQGRLIVAVVLPFRPFVESGFSEIIAGTGSVSNDVSFRMNSLEKHLHFKKVPQYALGSRKIKPSERINVQGYRWEQQASSFIKDVFIPAGFVVESFTKLPYLCEGDLYRNFYVLTDAVFVLRLR